FRCRNDVVGHLVIGHVAVLPDDLFVERIANALRHAALDLPFRQHRMQYTTHLLYGPEILNLSRVSHRIDGNLRHINGPRISAICLAVISLVIPIDSWRRFIAAERFHFAMGLTIARASGEELFTSVALA